MRYDGEVFKANYFKNPFNFKDFSVTVAGWGAVRKVQGSKIPRADGGV